MQTKPIDFNSAAPTHRCTECGALWRLWRKEETGADGDSWNLRSATCGKCCDMAPMGKQIVPLTWRDIAGALAGPVDPNHDLVPTLRMFGGAMTERAADAIEQLRAQVTTLRKQAAQHESDHARASHMWMLMVLPMQAAAIEAEETNTEEAMRWITNTLILPGLYPDLNDAKAAGGAQAWFDREKAAEEARYDGVRKKLAEQAGQGAAA